MTCVWKYKYFIGILPFSPLGAGRAFSPGIPGVPSKPRIPRSPVYGLNIYKTII